MRKKVLLLALTSILISLCVPAIAQQAYVKPEVFAWYVIEIGDISEETMARPKGKEDYTQNVYKFPEEITIKELIFSLPCTEKNISFFQNCRYLTMKVFGSAIIMLLTSAK